MKELTPHIIKGSSGEDDTKSDIELTQILVNQLFEELALKGVLQK
ncbi:MULTISPECIES: hypothetical protein [Bacillus]|nr:MULTISPECIES: hypothetical protein [Bacillus]MDJ1631910.1 hypothetical protein [Bacillus velezensis]MDQ8093958.1 hypothetical protein [Bacillus amyloliquefaciens]MED5046522.1 hypothetical protein [Bacillus siamensis]MED5098270.1 hypothetical protein [Bacillus siamensis]UVW10687.1 hypothetical protein NX856_06395 [Bacillus velezensis]